MQSEGVGEITDHAIVWQLARLQDADSDAALAEVGAKVPSSASPDHGAPVAEVFARYEQDFYKIDPMLFSPAEVVFHNLKTGRAHAFGRPAPEVLRRSFFGAV